MTETVQVDSALTKGLLDEVPAAGDASLSAPAPPTVHWLDDKGEPRYGRKADGSPRRSRPGPGAPRIDGKPRTTDKQPDAVPTKAAAVFPTKDYSDDLTGALTMLWLGLGVIPPTQPHAVVIHEATPALVPAINAAAQGNATIRSYVSKLGGTGSYSWALPLAMALAPVAAGLFAVARAPREQKEMLRAKTKEDVAEYIAALQEQAGVAPQGGEDQPHV